MKLPRCSFNNDNLDAYFDPAARIVYAVRTWRHAVFDVCAFDAERDEGDQRMLAAISVDFATEPEALAELDRIAALIEGKAPAQGWVAGPPPREPVASWVVYTNSGMLVVFAQSDRHHGTVWGTPDEDFYTSNEITHHLPTPIQPPKES